MAIPSKPAVPRKPPSAPVSTLVPDEPVIEQAPPRTVEVKHKISGVKSTVSWRYYQQYQSVLTRV